MSAFFAAHWATILVSIITAGLLAMLRWVWKEMKTYKSLLDQKDQQLMEEMVEKKTEAIYEELEELRQEAKRAKEVENNQLKLIISSFRFQLIGLCKTHLKRGYISPEDFDFLTEYYNIYHELGGNGQAQTFYEKAKNLPIKNV